MHGLSLGKSNLDVLADTLANMAQSKKELFVVVSDSRGSGKLTAFANQYPEQTVEVGIAEQALVSISAGIASTGKTVFAVSPASFLTARAVEQIKVDVSYSNNPVKLIGISGGVSYGAVGSTHHSLHDIALLRCVSNMSVIIPADNYETREAIRQAADVDRPVYIRLGKRPVFNLRNDTSGFTIEKARVIQRGRDAVIVGCGETVRLAWEAAQSLAAEGISCGVVSMHTIKPFDSETLLRVLEGCRAIVTVEEHCRYGGLGEACSAVLMRKRSHIGFRSVAFPDEDSIAGNQEEVFNHYGISSENLVRTVKELLEPGK